MAVFYKTQTVSTELNGSTTTNVTSKAFRNKINLKVGVSRPKPEGDFIPPTSYEREVADGNPYGFEIPSFHCVVERNPYYRRWTRWGNFVGGFMPAPQRPVCPSYVLDGARNKALSHLKAQRVNYAQAFGERRQAASMVAKNISRIRDAVRQVKRGNVHGALKSLKADAKKGFKHTTKDAASLWLELQYGWKPLLSDVHGTVEILNERDGFDPNRYTVSVIGKYSDHIDPEKVLVNDRYQVVPGADYYVKCYKEQAFFYKSKVRIDAHLTHPDLGLAASLGLTNPLDLAWELLPFSFVADWFVPVGKYLNLLDATSGFTFRAGSETVTAELLQRLSCGPVVYDSLSRYLSSKSYLGSPEFNEYRHFYMNRSVLSDFPAIGSLRLSKDPIRGLRVWNALALLRQVF